MKLITYPDRSALYQQLAEALKCDLDAALSRQDRASLGVPGGTTPGPVFDILSKMDLDWQRLDVMLTDERWVEETSSRSNTALIKQRLLTRNAARASYCPLYDSAPSPEDKIDRLIEGVDKICPLSVVLLGMGDDMHTASLFPGADQLTLALVDNAPTLLAMRAPGATEPRITLSARAINGAAAKHIVILGDHKRIALEQSQQIQDPLKAPVYSVLNNAIVHFAA